MADVATRGEGLVLQYSTLPFFTGSPADLSDKTDVTEVSLPPDPTWNDLNVAAAFVIAKSGDNHHIFIEQFKRDGNVVTLYTGS